MKILIAIDTVFPRRVSYHRRNSRDFYTLYFFHKIVTNSNPVDSDDGRP